MNPLPSKSSRRHRTLTFEKMESRRLLTATAGGLIESDVSDFNAESDTSVKFRIAVTDASGRAVTDVRAAEDFFLNVFVEDVREDPGGVFAAYLDLAFDSTRTFRSGDVVFGDTYSNVNVPGGTAPGLLDEVGGVSGSLVPLGEGEFLLFRAPFRANSPGTLSFVTNPADRTPSSLVLVYGAYEPLQSSQIDFGSANINVLPAAPVPTLAPTSGSFATEPTASFGQYLAPEHTAQRTARKFIRRRTVSPRCSTHSWRSTPIAARINGNTNSCGATSGRRPFPAGKHRRRAVHPANQPGRSTAARRTSCRQLWNPTSPLTVPRPSASILLNS